MTGDSSIPGSAGTADLLTVAYTARTGGLLWARRYNGPGNGDDRASALRIIRNGSEVFVTGSSTGTASGSDYATLAYNAKNGSLLWARRYSGPGKNDDRASALSVSPDGSKVFVAGSSTAATK